jgi:hypothetical protein
VGVTRELVNMLIALSPCGVHSRLVDFENHIPMHPSWCCKIETMSAYINTSGMRQDLETKKTWPQILFTRLWPPYIGFGHETQPSSRSIILEL